MRSNKNIVFALLFLLTGFSLFAQGYNNRWINFSQTYYKVKIPRDGIYRLDSATLAGAGIPIATFSPQNIQLFQRGKEIYPYIAGESDGVFNTGDYILFYAERNTSRQDSLMYDNVPYLTNPYYSVVNDSSSVFFTWNASVNNLRLTPHTDISYASYTPSPYYYKEFYTGHSDYSPGPQNALGQADPRYKLGEGQFFSTIWSTQTGAFTIPTAFAYKGTAPAYFNYCVSGSNDIVGVKRDHIIQLDYLNSSGTPQTFLPVPDSLSAYTTHRYSYTVDPSNFGASTDIRVNNLANPTSPIDNSVNINYISAFYPHQFNILDSAWEKIYLPDDATQSKSKLVITNFHGSAPVMIDVTDHLLLTLTPSGSTFLSLVPNSGGNKFCYLADQTAITNVSRIIPVNHTSTPGKFVNYFAAGVQDSAYIIVSNPKLMYGAGLHGINDYKAWRSSGAGGGNFNVILASAEDLSDQYCYGVDYNAMAVRNFCAHLIDTAIAAGKKTPSNLFLLGKGIHTIDVLNGLSGPPSDYASKCMVPTWGNPASDILMTKGLPGSINLEPAIPTGRLAAQTDADILSYLSKAELHVQQTADSLWKKRAIHFIGGNTAGDQNAFTSYMNGFKSIYEDTLIGGRVFSFKKTTTTPTSVTTNDSVRQLINGGVSLMTFFGHGSPTGFDENIDDPQTYSNSPRFPFILANSCFTGDINSAEQISHSEIFTLAPNNHGCIGYVATVTEGVANFLAFYTQEIYKQMSYKNYGNSYGTSVKNTVRQLIIDMPLYANDTMLILTALEMTLHGDPALRSYGYSKPDYTLTNSDVIFNTAKYADSIGLKIVMTNLGRAVKNTFVVKVQRNYPSGDTAIWYKTVKGPLYKDTLSFFVPLDYTKAIGKNDFYVMLDYQNFVPELNETNNSTTGAVSLFIKGSDIEPVWPYKYAIVPRLDSVTLKASTADPFAPLTTYRFQVDTNNKFQTLLVNTTVNAPGGVVSLPVSLYNQDSIVYYWRVAKDTLVSPNWKESSFQVLTGKYGWGQAHFNQFKNDFYQYVTYDTTHRRFNFVNTVKTIEVNDVVCYGPFYNNFTNIQFFYNGNQERLWSCAPDGWSVAVFDSITGALIPTDTLTRTTTQNSGQPTWIGVHGDCVCDYTTRSVTDFGNYDKCGDPITFDYRPNLVNFINSIPVGMKVLAYSVKLDTYAFPVNASMLAAFHSIGSSQIDNLTDTTVLIIYGKKGSAPGTAHEVLSSNSHQLVTLLDSITPHFNNGFIASEIIGPCKYSDTAWHSLHWCFHDLEAQPSPDSMVVQVIGIDANGHKHIVANFPKDSLDVYDLKHYVNGKQYPYIQLIALEADHTFNTPPQLKRWQVIFDQAPECAIDPPLGFAVVKNPVAEGEPYEVHMPIKNISDFKFDDSLLVTYNIQDAYRIDHALPYKLKKRPFMPGQVLIDTIKISTLGFAGTNSLWMDVNPLAHPKHQPEQFHFNNIAQISFDVKRDKINPMLDVTFDGIHILNGDIVSSRPVILVSLKDENKFLALNDTANFTVSLLAPGASKETRLNFNDNTLLFTPAQLPNNSCKINYHPSLLQDGKYTLHVVSTDRSKNISGQYDYRIQFDIINKPSITEVLNYPNPFSTSTKFVFTITGSEVPETFKIQIITITGKVVKEITRDELGFLHVGRNITDYAWDGKDQFGDQLANGVYLYRVQTRLNGNEIDHMNTSADSFFKKGYGKMLLMR